MASNIFFIINSLEGGGAERVFTELANNIEIKSGYNAFFIVLDDFDSKYKIAGNVKVLSKNKIISSVKLFFLFLTNRPVVAISFLPRSNFLNSVYSKLFFCKSIISERSNTEFRFRGALSSVKRNITSFVYNLANVVVSCSYGVQDCLVKQIKISKPKMDVIYNPYDVGNLSKVTSPNVENYFCAVGRLVKSKRFETIIKAVVGTQFRVKILGEGPMRNELEILARELGVSKQVEFMGFIKNPYEIVKGSSGFILSSECEGFPNALVESMILSVPCVVSNCKDGPSELMEFDERAPITNFLQTRFGLVFNVGDEVGLRNCLFYLKDNEKESMVMSAAAQQKCKEYNLNNFVKSFEKHVYE